MSRKKFGRRPPKRRDLLQPGNSHVGWEIHTFSLPAMSTCPGLTFACLLVCYAMRSHFAGGGALRAHKANWEHAWLHPRQFMRDMTEEVRFKRVKTLRIHVSGDFFSRLYVKLWIRVVRSCPTVDFLFYTRSWRVEAIRPHLLELATLPNVSAWWSEDRDSGSAVFPVGRRAFLCVDAADEALVPPGVDLVFRQDTRVARKWAGGVLVCPKENGVATSPPITCSACSLCLSREPFPVPPDKRGRGRDGSASQPVESEVQVVSASAASRG